MQVDLTKEKFKFTSRKIYKLQESLITNTVVILFFSVWNITLVKPTSGKSEHCVNGRIFLCIDAAEVVSRTDSIEGIR